MPVSIGDKLGPYQIVAPLGAGGMGQVWKARDTRLGRVVAIKLLKDTRNRRFDQEARAIAALNHPNICQIHDVGPGYLVLEYIEGQPLAGPYLPDETLRLAIQMANALEAAHCQGILHRDLKPANILVTKDGIVKLLDFGVSMWLRGGDPEATATADGTVIGTAAYMSPEQAQGQVLDERSDIFSFGSVLYEMLSGRRAFDGESAAQVIRSILAGKFQPIHGHPALERIVTRCLETAPADRFQTAAELKRALGQISGKPVPARPSIAVLPFENMSGDKDNEYFSDGLAEEIINSLAQLPGLKVIARTSAFAFKGRQEDIRRITETLGVDHALEGSVRRAGSRIRVTAQLIAGHDGSHLWSQRYDREWADVFAIQDDIAKAIVDTLRLKLATEPTGQGRHRPDLAAYEALLKARHDSLSYTPEASDRCRKNYEEAIALDPQFAQAHAELSIQLLVRALPGIASARDTMPLARAAAQRALELDSNLPEPQAVLGSIAGLYDYDWAESKRRFRLALARDPVPPSVRFLHGMFCLTPLGLYEEAVVEHGLGLQEDPLSFGGRFQLGVCFLQARWFTKAEVQFREVAKVYPTAFQVPMFLALTQAAQENLTEAVAFGEQAHCLAPWHSHTTAILAGLLVQTGHRQRARELLDKLKPPHAYGVPGAMTFYHLLCGEIDLAAEWSREAIAQRDPRIVLGLGLPLGDVFRSDPRGVAVLRIMNLAEAGPEQGVRVMHPAVTPG